MNFRELIDREAAYKNPARRPRSMRAMAERCGISRTYLYRLFRGAHTPPSWREQAIASGLGVKVTEVRKALAESRDQAVLS